MTMAIDRTTSMMQLHLPFSPESAGVARHRLAQWLHELGHVGDRCDDARLLVTELVANAVRHARPLDGGIRISWSRSHAVLSMSVTDGGSATRPAPTDASTGATGGRGLAIVEILAHRWWVEDRDEHTTVHAELHLD